MSERAFGERASSLSVLFGRAPHTHNRQLNVCVHIGNNRYMPGLAIMNPEVTASHDRYATDPLGG